MQVSRPAHPCTNNRFLPSFFLCHRYHVLALPLLGDATEEDIKQRYRKISSLVHPDKCRPGEQERARDAFEEVTKAYVERVIIF